MKNKSKRFVSFVIGVSALPVLATTTFALGTFGSEATAMSSFSAIKSDTNSINVWAYNKSYYIEYQPSNPDQIGKSESIYATSNVSSGQIPNLAWSITDFDQNTSVPNWIYIVNDDPIDNQIHVEWKPDQSAIGTHTFTITATAPGFTSGKSDVITLNVQTQDIRQANLILQSTSFDPNSCETSLSTSNTIAHHNASITSIAIDFQYDLNALNQIDPDTNEYKYKAGTYVFADLYGNAIKPVILNSLSLSLNIHHDAKNFWYDQRNWDNTFTWNTSSGSQTFTNIEDCGGSSHAGTYMIISNAGFEYDKYLSVSFYRHSDNTVEFSLDATRMSVSWKIANPNGSEPESYNTCGIYYNGNKFN